MSEKVLQLVPQKAQVQTEIKNLFNELSDRFKKGDPEVSECDKAIVILLEDKQTLNQENYKFTLITANMVTSEVIALLELSKHRTFETS